MALQALQFILPKKKASAGGTSYTTTFRPGTPLNTAPTYKDHLSDIFTTRVAGDSRTLMQTLARHDPDVSSSIFAYGTLADSATMVVEAFDLNGVESVDGIPIANSIMERLFTATDYTLGYNPKLGRREFMNELRYMCLLRGSAAFELILNKQLEPDSLRIVDTATLTWRETAAGMYKPFQKTAGTQGDGISLDIPTFFQTRFHQDPTDIYTYSSFVSAINTIAARTQVITELYRIMQVTGYPRLDITILEDIISANAPATLRQDPKARQSYVNDILQSVRGQFEGIRSDQAFIHTNGVEAKMINDKNPGAGVQIKEVIETLDSQNQAALKTMPSVVGKGTNGTVASAESRLFAIHCDSLNNIVAGPLSEALTLAARIAGFQGSIRISFRPVELRPTMELEPQFTMRQSRLQSDLSLGIITDHEYHMSMYNRPKPASAPDLSGTGFADKNPTNVDANGVSPNADPLGKSLSGDGAQGVRSKGVKNGN